MKLLKAPSENIHCPTHDARSTSGGSCEHSPTTVSAGKRNEIDQARHCRCRSDHTPKKSCVRGENEQLLRWSRKDRSLGQRIRRGLPSCPYATPSVTATLAQIPPEIGVVGCRILDGTVSFETVRQSKGHRLLEPLPRAEIRPPPDVSKLVRTSLVSPMALRVVRYLLQHNSTTQTKIANDMRVSVGMVNKVVSALTQRELVSYRGKQLVVFDVWKLLNEISWNRPFRSLKNGEIHVGGVKSIRELETKLVQVCEAAKIRYALTLFSGASRYIGYGMKYDSAQAYVERGSALSEELERGGTEAREGMVLEIYNIDTWDIIEEAKTIEGVVVCSPAQLVMDLVSYGSVGRDWAVRLYEATLSASASPVKR